MSSDYNGGREAVSLWQQLLGLAQNVPAWAWVAGAAVVVLVIARPFLPPPIGPAITDTSTPVTATSAPITATPTPVTVTPAPPVTGFLGVQATKDVVWVVSSGQPTQTLTVPEIAHLFVGDRVNVNEKGRAIARFPNLLEIEVMREGRLIARELDIAERSALAVFGQSGGAFVNNLDSAAARTAGWIETHLNVESDYALITATGTRWAVIKERNTPLEWVVALEAGPNDLTVESDGVTRIAPTGVAYWIAPFGGPSIPIYFQNVQPWLESVYAGDVKREIGDVLWPQADVITDTRSIGTYTETVASSGQNPPVVVLDDVILELDSNDLAGPYELRDCNKDGILDIYMDGGYIRFDFRGMRERVRAIDVQVTMTDRSDVSLTAFNPDDQDLILGWEELDGVDGSQLLSLRSDMRLQAADPEHQPFHYADLGLTDGCFLGLSLTPPNEDSSPGAPRWPVEQATPTVTVTPTPSPTASSTATPTPSQSATATPTPSTTASVTPTSTSTSTATAIPKKGEDIEPQIITKTPTETLTPTPTGLVTTTATSTVTPTPMTPTNTPTPTPTPTCVPRQPTDWVVYVVTVGDTANEIADARGIPLRQLADVNCLYPPKYVIQVKQELRVPPVQSPPCSTEAEIKLGVRKVDNEQIIISWASNCFVTGTAAQVNGFATTPLTLIVGRNGSKQIGLGRSCRAGDTFIIFELWYAAGQKRTVTMQVEC